MSKQADDQDIEEAVDQVADHIENDLYNAEKADEVGLTLSEFMKRVAQEIEARGS